MIKSRLHLLLLFCFSHFLTYSQIIDYSGNPKVIPSVYDSSYNLLPKDVEKEVLSPRLYDHSGNAIFGRKIIKQNWKALFKGRRPESGIIALMVCVNRDGEVHHAEIIDSETTIAQNWVLERAIKAAKGYLYEADPSAPLEQCGKLIFNMDLRSSRNRK